MKEIILIKDGELALKGLNRSSFEAMLMKNIRWRIKPFGSFELKQSQSTITVNPLDGNADLDSAAGVFPVYTRNPHYEVPPAPLHP